MTSNPLDDLRQINREQRAAEELPVSTAVREAVLTEGSKEGITGARKPVRKGGSTASRTAVLQEAGVEGREDSMEAVQEEITDAGGVARLPAEKSSRKYGSTGTRTDLREQVRATVTERRVYQGGVKATLDLAPDLSTRFKRYSIDHHNVTLRQLMTELLDTYLSGEGY